MKRRRFLTIGILAFGLAGTLGPHVVTQAHAEDSKELVVFAAASLREVFQTLATHFEKKHPGLKVRLNLAGSQELRVQIEQGAKADVFASADTKHMQSLQKQGLAQASRIFAHNEPVLIVPTANPAKLTRFADLPKAERIVVGVPEVPIGAYTETILHNATKTLGAKFHADVTGHIRSRELNVRQVLTKVSLGEGDAGIVYKTDALSAKDKVSVIQIPDDINVIADYPVAVLSDTRQPALAKEWIDTLLGEEGRKALATAGFKHPVEVATATSKK